MIRHVVVMLVLCAAQSAGEDLKTELIRLHAEWYAAFNKGDGATMDRMEVPNLVLVGADAKGGIWQKPGARAGKQRPRGDIRRTLTDVQVRQFGGTAILTGILTSKSAEQSSQASTTVVWVRQSDQWLIASVHWTSLNELTK